MKSIALILGLVACVSLRSHAWNAEGHMVVAQIAYNHLKPVVKAQCDALVATPVVYATTLNNTFATASVWADDLKSFTNTWNGWHFINIPFSLDGTTTNGFVPASFDVVKAIRTNIYFLQHPATTQSNRAFHLRMLLHFVGDMHQPLHCTTAMSTATPNGDAGGNGFPVTGWGNLHALWDSGGERLQDSFSRPLNSADQNTFDALVASIETSHPYDYTTNLGTVPDPMVWAFEGVDFAQSACYAGITRNTTPTPGYLVTTATTADHRLASGGQRLADLLNTILATNAVHLTSITRTGSNVSFSWPGLFGRSYQVQSKTNLSDATWNNVTVISPSANQTVTFSEPMNQARRFYRVAQ